MKLKLCIVLVSALTYFVLVFTHGFTVLARSLSLDGVNPPHAVDTSGKAILDKSTTQPDKPIILGKDSGDPKRSELKPEAAFDHSKHSSDVMYSIDGKTLTACIECHHTAQSSSTDKSYLKKFTRKAALTVAELESSKEPVQSCRACHLQATTEATDEYPPEGVEYPKSSGKRATETLTNDVAYHINCTTCHTVAVKRDPKLKIPQTCAECHSKK